MDPAKAKPASHEKPKGLNLVVNNCPSQIEWCTKPRYPPLLVPVRSFNIYPLTVPSAMAHASTIAPYIWAMPLL